MNASASTTVPLFASTSAAAATTSLHRKTSCSPATSTSTISSTAVTKSIFTSNLIKPTFTSSSSSSHSHHPFLLRVTNDPNRSEDFSSAETDADKIVDGMNFGELCNEFECISSPLVESTARQLVRDILELREGNRALGTFAVSVQYKDPVRSFSGREKYKRPLWITRALDKPSVTVQEMTMLSTSVLSIKWTIKGKVKNVIGGIGGDLIIKINSQFTLNQISGQVTQHEEFWDLSASSVITKAYFWSSRRLFAAIEGGKDLADLAKTISSRFPREKQNMEIFPDPSGDPTKFFQRDDGFQRDIYQIGLLLALVYFVVQFLKTTL